MKTLSYTLITTLAASLMTGKALANSVQIITNQPITLTYQMAQQNPGSTPLFGTRHCTY